MHPCFLLKSIRDQRQNYNGKPLRIPPASPLNIGACDVIRTQSLKLARY
jgi:hypothetical protein